MCIKLNPQKFIKHSKLIIIETKSTLIYSISAYIFIWLSTTPLNPTFIKVTLNNILYYTMFIIRLMLIPL